MEYLTKDVKYNIDKIDTLIGVNISFDIGRRELVILDKQIYLYYLSSLIDSQALTLIITNLLKLNDEPNKNDDYFELIVNNIAYENIKYQTNLQNICEDILNGLVVVIVEGEERAISVELRKYPTRSISEPDMEKVIRGPHDGFTENLSVNIALLRRRIKDIRLRNIIYPVGTKSKTNCCISYLEGVCDPSLIRMVCDRLKQINTLHLILTDKALEEMLLKQKFNPYPLVRYTERADTVAVHLYQGMIAIFVDTSPSVILAPATLFDHLQHFEEYRQTPLAGTYLRFLRFGGVLLVSFDAVIFTIKFISKLYPKFS